MQGWPTTLVASPELQPYYQRCQELSVEDGCLLRGTRVIVPPSLRGKVLDQLHDGHPGIVRMKSLVRQYVWWPGLDADLEGRASQCVPCQECRKSPPSAPLHPWEWTKRPRVRVHADYAGPFLGHMFLVLIDSHSKWMEVHMTNFSTTAVTIAKMRSSFATLGLPEQYVTNNGPSFTCEEFAEFLRMNGIKHITTAPYHLGSNGLAERAVQTLKRGLKMISEGSWEHRLARFFLTYRATPYSTTGVSPSELMFGRQLRTRMDPLWPDLGGHVRSCQEQQKKDYDAHVQLREFAVGAQVLVKKFGWGPLWLPGVVKKLTGTVSYTDELEDGRVVRRHVDHVRGRTSPDHIPPKAETPDGVSPVESPTLIPDPPESPAGDSGTLRCSSHQRQAPERFGIPVYDNWLKGEGCSVCRHSVL